MTADSQSVTSTNLDRFRQKVSNALRQSGRLQKELAQALGIHPQVLSRKLHGAKNNVLTHGEVKQIVKALAGWDAIATQSEGVELLSLMGLPARSFSVEEWESEPLTRLQRTEQVSSKTHKAYQSSQITFSSTIPQLPVPSTTLLGRESQLQLLYEKLEQPSLRLLTLLGTGGVGKTRLALEVTQMAQQLFADGVFFIPLATLYDVSLVPSTIVKALRLPEPLIREEKKSPHLASQIDILNNFLRKKNILLVLDNVEQLPHIGPLISELLSNALYIKILITSRIVLHVYGEMQFEVPPLEICTPENIHNPTAIAHLAAVRLFVERAQALNPSFQLTAENATIIAQICTRLDGLPLAIELAASRTKMLSLSAILQLLTDGTGQSLTRLYSKQYHLFQRHKTLHEMLDWSYKLLTVQQQRLFRRICVFLGSWTAEAVQVICQDEEAEMTDDTILEQLEELSDHSLIKRVILNETEQTPRFAVLETIREYGLMQMEQQQERAKIQCQHAHYYLDLVELNEENLYGNKQAQTVAILVPEQDNIRAALKWASDQNEYEILQRICGAMGKFWEARVQFHEAHLWIDRALMIEQPTDPAVKAKLLMAASRLALWEIDYERSRTLAEQALVLYADLPASQAKHWAIFQLGDSWHMQSAYDLATDYFEQCLDLFQADEDWVGYAFTLSRMGAMAILQGNFVQAWTLLQKALPLLRKYSEPGLLNVNLIYLGTLALAQGEVQQSSEYLLEGLLMAQQADNRYMFAIDLIPFGCLLGAVGGPVYAAHVCSAAETMFASLNTSLPAAYRPLYNAYIDNLKTQIDASLWQTWWQEGKDLSQEALIDLILEICDAL